MAKSSSQERRAACLRGFEESGLPLAEFCRREGLAYSTVLNWRRLAREAASVSVSVSPDFVVVEALPPEAEPPAVRGANEHGERTVAAGRSGAADFSPVPATVAEGVVEIQAAPTVRNGPP